MWDRLLEWDRETLIFLNNLGVEQFDPFWETVTKYPPWIPLFAIILLLIFKAYHWKEVFGLLIVLAILILFMDTLTNLVKTVVARSRPNNDEELKNLIRILREPSSYSFFSGHASMSFTITTFVYFCLRQHFNWLHLLFIWPFLFALSRIYLGVHFPLDVVVGALVGMLSAWIFYKLHETLILPYLRSVRP